MQYSVMPVNPAALNPELGWIRESVLTVLERAQRATFKVMLRKPFRVPIASLYDESAGVLGMR